MCALVRAVADEYGAQPDAAPVVVASPDVTMVARRSPRLERVIQNIIDNAVKYSPERTPIYVTVSEQGAWVAIVVRDSGVGIPADELPRLFTHFYRASTAGGVRGSGIGLAGARASSSSLVARFELESAVGQGTTVTIRLPRLQL